MFHFIEFFKKIEGKKNKYIVTDLTNAWLDDGAVNTF
jgi:hypothetical protein